MSDLVDIRGLEEARTRFTELGSAISDLSTANTESFEALVNSIQGSFKKVMDDLSGDPRMAEGYKMVGSSEAYVTSMAQRFGALSGEFDSVFSGMQGTLTNVERSFESMSRNVSTTISAATPEGGGEGGGEGGELESDKAGGTTGIEKQKKDAKKPKTKMGKYMSSEVKTLKGRIGGLLSKLKIPKPAAVAAGFLGIMVYGYMEKDRVRAQTGEMKNILIAAYDDGVKGALAKGTQRLSAIQESFQRFYSIQREEIQKTAQAFVDGGFSVAQMTAGVDTKLKGVHSSAVTTTFALDKMFELGGGESAKRMIGLMADYGKNADEARKSLLRMYMVGRDSGIGAMQFVKNVEEAGSELASMGYNIDNVVDIYKYVTDAFEKMGVPKQFAGKQAALGLQQVSGGIVKMSDNWKTVLGERLGYGRGLEARQKMMDAFLRVLEGQDTGEVTRMVSMIFEMAMQATGQNEESARYYMETQMGLGFEGARLITKVGKDIRAGKTVEAAQATKENISILKNSFQTEATKRSQFEQTMNKWLKGMSHVGQGLLGLVIQALAYLLAYLKALPEFIINAVKGDRASNERMSAEIDALLGSTQDNKAKITRGLGQMADSFKGMAGDIMGPSINALKAAWDYDPYKAAAPNATGPAGSPATAGIPSWGAVSVPMADVEASSAGTPITKTITPPRPAKSTKTAGGKGKAIEDQWVGGGLQLAVRGVDTEGNISITITGNCPRCGFSFSDPNLGYSGVPGEFTSMGLKGEGKFTGEDVEALARMIQSETGPLRADRKKEQLGAAWAALNRRGARKGGGSLQKTITKGKGWGMSDAGVVSGGRRQFASRAKPDQPMIDFARSVLRGDKGTADPTGGATSFVHRPIGSKYGHKNAPKEKELVSFAIPNDPKNREATFFK